MRKFLVVSAVLVLAMAVWYGFKPPERGGDRGDTTASVDDVVPPSEAPDKIVAKPSREDGTAPSRDEAFGLAEEVVGTEGVSTIDATDQLPLTGVVLGPLGLPFPNAVVEVQRSDWDLVPYAVNPEDQLIESLMSVTTEQDGRFSFLLPRGAMVRIAVEAEGHPDRVRTRCFAGDEIIVRLRSGAALSGYITRKRDGTPVRAASIRGFRLDGNVTLFEGDSDVSGAYAFPGIPPGSFTVEVVAPDLKTPGWIEVHLGDAERRRLDVALEAGITITGKVYDAGTGEAIVGAVVGEGQELRRPVLTNELGEYTYRGFGSPMGSMLVAQADGYGLMETARYRVSPDQTGVERDIAMLPSYGIHGRVADRLGQPVVGARVTALCMELALPGPDDPPGPGRFKSDRLSDRTDENGEYRIPDLRSDGHHALTVWHRDYAVVSLDLGEPPVSGGWVEVVPIALTGGVEVRGRVIDEFGRGISAAIISLEGENDLRRSISKRDDPWFRGGVDWRDVTADADGWFCLSKVAPGSYALTPRIDYGVEGEPLELPDLQSDVRGLTLTIELGESIRGTVTDTSGTPTRMALVAAVDDAGERAGHSVPVGFDGEFHISGLKPGRYEVLAMPIAYGNDLSGPPWVPGRVGGVLAGSADVRVAFEEGRRVRGTVRDASGVPFAGAKVRAVDRDTGDALASGTSYQDGVFVLTLAPEADYLLDATAEGEVSLQVSEDPE